MYEDFTITSFVHFFHIYQFVNPSRKLKNNFLDGFFMLVRGDKPLGRILTV
ncbi:hypothetical protein [Priestia filamentosa]|uniref:hypothetical protein n=1 Tax=Priestia filamentosa TaxID=1402861 RepID=UPI0002EA4E53|nr:hypothetical protein [Priestia filamentosa]